MGLIAAADAATKSSGSSLTFPILIVLVYQRHAGDFAFVAGISLSDFVEEARVYLIDDFEVPGEY